MEGLQALNSFLLQLYEDCQRWDPHRCERQALARLRTYIDFDDAVWGHGVKAADRAQVSIRSSVAFTATADPDPGNLPSTDDTVALAQALEQPAGSVVHDCGLRYSHAINLNSDGGQPHLLNTAVYDEITRLCTLLVCRRRGTRTPFSESNRAALELAAPHLVIARRFSVFHAIRQRTRSRATRMDAAALCDTDGTIRILERAFRDALSAEFPAWRGPSLPFAVTEGADSRKPIYAGERIEAFVRRLAGGQLYVTVRSAAPHARLSHQQRAVARLLSEGRTYKEVARDLSIAPHTVTKHVNAVYAKLRVTSKAELKRYWATVVEADSTGPWRQKYACEG